MSPAATPPDSRATRAKRWGLGAALALTCVAALWPVEPVEDEPAEARRTAATARLQGGVAVAMAQSPRPAPAASAPAAAARSLPDRSQWSEVRVYRDPFDNPEGLEPPAPKPAPKAAAAPPSAASAPPPPPALTVPWAYAGRLLVPGQPDAVLLHDGPRTVPLAVGATLGDWRLEADRGQQLDFIHLPTGASVVLPLPQ